MPELPEVETVRSVLSPRLVGHKFIKIDVLYERMIHSSKESLSLITNQTITEIKRIGKYLIFVFENEYALLSHLRMEGKYYFYNLDEDNSRFARVIFYLDNEQKVCYDDSRKFGVMKVIHLRELYNDPWIKVLGPEPMNIDDPNYLYQKAKRCSKPIKTLLLDQSFMAGLGNIYVDETLFLSKIHPLTKANALSLSNWNDVLKSATETLLKAIKLGGSTIKSYHASREVDGLFQEELLVYGKKGEPCPICGNKLSKIIVGGRGTTFCSHCQKLLGKTVIGLTGVIGSGKSTALKIFKNFGADTISSDDIVSELYQDKEIIKLLEKNLSINLLDGDIFLKDNLRDLLTSSLEAKSQLEAILYPIVKERLLDFVYHSRKKIIVLEIPRLFEAGFEDIVDLSIAIKISNENQYYNLLKRGQKDIDNMIKLNYKGEEYPYASLVDYYLDSHNNEEILEKLIKEIYINL